MTNKALFAAGCFWGVQYYFDQIPGVVSTTVGYSGGHTQNPTYNDVATRTTGHAETVLVEFDPSKISYQLLVKHFFRMHDPTQLNHQGPDVGEEYRSEIFYFDHLQKTIAEKLLSDLQRRTKKKIVTKITPAGSFYEAEAVHQKFTQHTGIGMCHVPYKQIA